MYIFIDTISQKSSIILFDDKKIISSERFDIIGKEYDNFLEVILDFLNRNNLVLDNLSGIVIINGPGGFTGTRIISLTINTLAFVKKIRVDSINYFEFLEQNSNPYPMLIKANRGECLIKTSKESEPILINIENITEGNYSGIGDVLDFENKRIYIKGNEDYNNFIKGYSFKGKIQRIEPYYIKKPNIS